VEKLMVSQTGAKDNMPTVGFLIGVFLSMYWGQGKQKGRKKRAHGKFREPVLWINYHTCL
jgi:hypothetical protein